MAESFPSLLSLSLSPYRYYLPPSLLYDNADHIHIKLNAASPLQNWKLRSIASREIDRPLSIHWKDPKGTLGRVSLYYLALSIHRVLTHNLYRLYVRNGGAPSLTKEDIDESHDRQPAYHWVSTHCVDYRSISALNPLICDSSMGMEC